MFRPLTDLCKRRPDLVLVAALIAAWACMYAPVLGFQFVTSDDWELLVHNPRVRHWTDAALLDRFYTTEFSYAIPVTEASWAADFALGGGRPWVVHLGNALWHLGTSLLLFGVLRTFASSAPAALGAALFLLHPIQAEAVGFVTSRKELLAGFFLVLGAWLVRGPAPPARALCGAILCALASAFSKPSGATSGLLLAALWTLSRRRDRPVRAPAFALALALLALAPLWTIQIATRIEVHGSGVRVHAPSPERSPGSRVIEAAGFYARELLSPRAPSPRTAPSLALSPTALAWGALALLAPAIVLAWAARRRSADLAQPVLWTALAYAPVSNLVPLKRFVTDAYFYSALQGVCLGVALALESPALSARPRLRAAALATVCLTLLLWAPVTRHYLSVWQDDDTLHLYVYRTNPESLTAMRTLVNHLYSTGRPGPAHRIETEYHRRGLREFPDRIDLRYEVFRLCSEAGDEACAQTVFDQTPHAQHNQRQYQEMRLALAMRRGDRATALDAAQAIARIDPSSGRDELVRRLRTQPR